VLKHIQERRRDEEGFTLIELMVVVLIMGILMAIAIPTFLSTRGSANDASAKSNATNAYTNEKSYYASNQVFVGGSAALDDTLPWGTAAGDVQAYSLTFNSVANSAVIVEAFSKSSNCFYIEDIEENSAAYIGYYSANTGCATAPTASNLSASTPEAGSSGVQSTALGTTWYQSW